MKLEFMLWAKTDKNEPNKPIKKECIAVMLRKNKKTLDPRAVNDWNIEPKTQYDIRNKSLSSPRS